MSLLAIFPIQDTIKDHGLHLVTMSFKSPLSTVLPGFVFFFYNTDLLEKPNSVF